MTLEEAKALFPDPGLITQTILWMGQPRIVQLRVLKAGEEQNVLHERARAGATKEEQDHQESLSRFGRALMGVDGQEIKFANDPVADLQERMAFAMDWPDPLSDQIGMAYSRIMERAVANDPSTYSTPDDMPPMPVRRPSPAPDQD